jgi:hypothetical protein
VEIVVLDDVWIRDADSFHQPADQIPFPGVASIGRFENFRFAGVVADRDHEDAVAPRVESRGLQIELQPAQLVEGKVAEVGPTSRDEVLLFRWQREHTGVFELANVAHALAQSLGGTEEDGGCEDTAVIATHEVSQGAWAVELAIAKGCPGAVIGPEPGSEVAQVVETVEQKPGSEALLLAHEHTGAWYAAPDHDSSVRFRVNGDDARGRIPAPEPFVADRHRETVRMRHPSSYALASGGSTDPCGERCRSTCRRHTLSCNIDRSARRVLLSRAH